MLLLAADENFNNNIVRGALRLNPDLDVLRVQDAGLRGADDSSFGSAAGDGQPGAHRIPGPAPHPALGLQR
jgi:hypothetical protein